MKYLSLLVFPALMICQAGSAFASQPDSLPAGRSVLIAEAQSGPASSVRFSHVAIALPAGVSLESGMKWYKETMGFVKAWDIKEQDMNDRAASDLPRRLFGEGFKKVRYVKLVTPDNAMALELFELSGLKSGDSGTGPARRGYVHMCVAADDPDALAAKIVKAGGKEIWRSGPDSAMKAYFCSDPWGNMIEIFITPPAKERR
jgi:hypothetical protein